MLHARREQPHWQTRKDKSRTCMAFLAGKRRRPEKVRPSASEEQERNKKDKKRKRKRKRRERLWPNAEGCTALSSCPMQKCTALSFCHSEANEASQTAVARCCLLVLYDVRRPARQAERLEQRGLTHLDVVGPGLHPVLAKVQPRCLFHGRP